MAIPKAMALILSVLMTFLALGMHDVRAAGPTPGSSLSSTYYDGLCGRSGTKVLQDIAFLTVAALVKNDSSLIPSLIRLAFHDSFVEGTEASDLLDNSPGFPPVEKDGLPNRNSLRGFEVIDAVKTKLEAICPRVFSCADILQESVRVAMRVLPLFAGSLPYNIKYGRRDGNVSLASATLGNLPPPNFNYTQLKANFAAKFFNPRELLLLSGAHCFGVAHCRTLTGRLYNFNGNGSGTDPSLDPAFAAQLKMKCPQNGTGDNTVPLNFLSPNPKFDNQYYRNIQAHKVLFISDNALQVGDPATVNLYAQPGNNNLFRNDFIRAFVKMTELQVILFPNGEIRTNCRKRN